MTGISFTSDSAAPRAFLYRNGQMQDLGTFGGYESDGFAINNAGQVTGTSTLTTSTRQSHAFLYSNGEMKDLGTLPGYDSSSGYSINNAGQVTGRSFDIDFSNLHEHTFLYSNGQMMDLNDLIDPALGITLTMATGINDSGQIVANDYFGVGHAFLLTPDATPVPEPSTLALFGVALLGLGAWACRHPNVFR